MKIVNCSRIAAGLVAVVLIAGCQSSATLNITQEKTMAIEPGKTVSLSVEPGTQDPNEDTQEVIRRVRTELFGSLVSERIFRQVLHAEEPADYKMEIKVQGAREVSTAARIFFGVFAGSNNLVLSVFLKNATTGQPITAFDVKGESASHPLSTEAGLDDAVREAVTKIIDALR